MFKSIWNRLKEDFSEEHDNTLPEIKSRPPMPKKVKAPKIKVNIVPVFNPTQANIDKYSKGDSYSYTDEHKEQVDGFINILFENFDTLVIDHYNIKFKGTAKKSAAHKFQIETWVANGSTSVKFDYIMKSGKTFTTNVNREQAAKVMFLKEKLLAHKAKKLKDELNAELNIESKSFTTMVTSSGKEIKITQKDIIDSLRITSPEYFV